MSAPHAIKQVEERTVPCEINLMLWSDRMDLVALSNTKGEVTLHRLTKTKAWTLKAPKEGWNVKGMCWRPDGKIIAIAYNSGEVLLVEVETQTILQVPSPLGNDKSEITFIHWLEERKSKQTNYMKTIDNSNKFIPDPPTKTSEWSSLTTDENQKCFILQEQNELNLLVIGTHEGFIHISIFGCFPCASLNVNEMLESKCSIQDVHLSEDVGTIFATVNNANGRNRLVIIDSAIFRTHSNELFAIGLKYVKLQAHLNNLSKTITSITETWESILLEMDNKLSKYASKVAEGGVTADFLDLLMFGMCSEEMKEFLIHDLTKKGLDKFGQTIEMSYSNIQKLLLKYVAKFGQNITYHLSELRGMSRLRHRYYDPLGLNEDVITEAISANGSFMIKGGEMQQIINHSIINYKAFFRWLYTAILHLLDEKISTDFPKMTQQDLAYIAEFLQNFDHIGRENFKMERLGQYLNDAPLHTSPNMDSNEWYAYLIANGCVRKNASVLEHYRTFSLVQQYKHLCASIDAIFVKPKDVINTRLRVDRVFDLGENEMKVSRANSEKSILFAFFARNHQRIDLIEMNGGEIKCGRILSPLTVIDLKFYSAGILTALLQETTTKSTVIHQLDLTSLLNRLEINNSGVLVTDSSVNEIDIMDLTAKLSKHIEGMVGVQIAVSGTRKVSIVLSENRRKLKVFEMEGDEEEDEDADMSGGNVSAGGLFRDSELETSR